MASSNINGNGALYDEHMASFKEEILASIAKTREKIIQEARSHFTVVSNQLIGIWEDIDHLQFLVENLATKLINLNLKVDSMEVMVESAMVGFLKEAFGLVDVSFPSDELVMQVDEIQGEEAAFPS